MTDLDIQFWVVTVQSWSIVFGTGMINKMLDVMRSKNA